MYQNLSFLGFFLRIWFRKMFRWSLKWSFLSLQRLWVVAPSVAPPHVLLAPPFHGHLAPPPRPQKNYTVTWQQTTVHQSVFGTPLLLYCPANQKHRLLVKAHVSKLLQKEKDLLVMWPTRKWTQVKSWSQGRLVLMIFSADRSDSDSKEQTGSVLSVPEDGWTCSQRNRSLRCLFCRLSLYERTTSVLETWWNPETIKIPR